VLKDFDIGHEAKGVDKAIFRNLQVVVKNKTIGNPLLLGWERDNSYPKERNIWSSHISYLC
jgi:hypothetical protein